MGDKGGSTSTTPFVNHSNSYYLNLLDISMENKCLIIHPLHLILNLIEEVVASLILELESPISIKMHIGNCTWNY